MIQNDGTKKTTPKDDHEDDHEKIPTLQRCYTVVYTASEGSDIVGEFFKKYDYRVIIGMFATHWIFTLCLPLAYGIHSDCDNGYPLACHIIFGCYLFVFFLIEVFLAANEPEFWRWTKSRTHITKNIRGPHWTIPLIIDSLTSIFSKLDLYTDFSFLWIAYKCGIYFNEALIMMIIGVGLFQFCPLLVLVVCFIPMCAPTPGYVVIHAVRGADMMIITKWFSALTGTSDMNEAAGLFNAKTFDSIIAFFRFLFEDLAQAIIQVLFLLHPKRDGINNSTSVLVLCSVCFALILSFIRAMAFVVDPAARKSLLDMLQKIYELHGIETI